jgi:hypothetical protein
MDGSMTASIQRMRRPGLLNGRRAMGGIMILAIIAPIWFMVDGRNAKAGLAGLPAAGSAPDVCALARRVASSVAMVGVCRNGKDLDLVLWSDDADEDAEVDPSEICVLSFRSRHHTLIWYERDGGARADGDGDHADILTTSFLQRWKARADVRATILATNISDVTIVPRSAGHSGWVVLPIRLKWTVDRADGDDRGMADVAAVMLPRQAKEFSN